MKAQEKAAAAGFKAGQQTETPAEANERIFSTIAAPEEKVDVGKAIAAKMKAQEKAAAAGFKAGQQTETPAEANERISSTIAAPEEKVDVGKAIRASMTIRAAGEAAIAKLEDRAELKQNVKDQLAGFIKELPREIRPDFITNLRDAKTVNDLKRALDRMDSHIEAYNARNAAADLYDAIGKPVAPKQGGAPTLRQELDKQLVVKPADPFADGKIDPKKQFPAARDALSDLVGNLRTAGNANAGGARKLADFIQSERDAGHSNDGALSEADIEKLRGMEGKPVASLDADQRTLLTQAIRHAAYLGEQYNEANAHSRASDVKHNLREPMMAGTEKFHEPLKPGTRGGVETEPHKNPLSNWVGNVLRDPFRFLKLNFGKGGETLWQRLVDGQTNAMGARHDARDVVQAAMDQMGVSKSQMRDMAKNARTIDLGDGQRINLTPREIMAFINNWARPQTREQIMNAGIVPERLAADPKANRSITPESAQRIIDAATPAEKHIASVMQRFLNGGKLRDAANRESVNEWGFEKLTEPNYWPRRRALEQISRGVPDTLQEVQQGLLKDAGFLKEAKGSKAPVMISDALDVFHGHVDALAKFAHQNGTIRDALMVAKNPEFNAHSVERLGSNWDRQYIDTLKRFAGLDDNVSLPGAGMMNTVRNRLAAGTLIFRLTSAANHYLGNALALNPIPEGSRATFLKNFARKAIPDMALIRDMESRSPYFRSRGEGHAASFETAPIETESGPKGKVGRALDTAGDIGTAHIRLSDRMDSATIYKTFIETYKRAHPGATVDETRNWAVKQAEYAQRKAGTASTPAENSYLAQKMSRIPVVNLLTLFQSKTSAMRNTLDEAYNDWRVDKNPKNAAALGRALATVAFMTATYAAIGKGSTALIQGFAPKTKAKEDKAAHQQELQEAAHIGDIIAPGIGGNAIRTVNAAFNRGQSDNNIAIEPAARATQETMQAIDSGKKGNTAAMLEKAMGAVNNLGKYFGVSAEQPTQYGWGIYHALHDTDETRAQEKAQSKIDAWRGRLEKMRP
jgi:hypothetical protein